MQLDYDISTSLGFTCVWTMTIIKTCHDKPTVKFVLHETLTLPAQALEFCID